MKAVISKKLSAKERRIYALIARQGNLWLKGNK